MRFHYPGLVHLPVSDEYAGCAFTMKVHKLSRMLLSLGHEVFVYGAEGSNVPCTEFIQTHTLKEIRDTWGDIGNNHDIGYDWQGCQFRHDFNKPRTALTQKFIVSCIKEINRRKDEDDFFLNPQGYYFKPIDDGTNLYLSCEPGIGYRGSYPSSNRKHFRAFESAYIMNFTYGRELSDVSPNGNYYDRVIPNYFDPKDFEFSAEKDDYFLYIGRMIIRKGVWTAVKATEAIGAKLVLAGQRDPEIDINSLPKHCEFVGYVNPKERTHLMKKARATFVPTMYLEPFAGVHIESMLCGTPVITTNFGVFPETVVNGENGYRCDTLQDFVDAAGKTLDPFRVVQYGRRYLMDNVKHDFNKWFKDLYQVYLSTKGAKGWHYLR